MPNHPYGILSILYPELVLVEHFQRLRTIDEVYFQRKFFFKQGEVNAGEDNAGEDKEGEDNEVNEDNVDEAMDGDRL